MSLGFSEPIRALVVGGQGGVGGAFVHSLLRGPEALVWSTSRCPEDSTNPRLVSCALEITDEDSIKRVSEEMRLADFTPNLVLNCTGVLSTEGVGPERAWRELNIDVMRRVFDVNAFGVALLAKHFIPLFPRDQRCVFASLSARVGSIEDNRLGGWYSYRASKAAQNMFIKGLAIEGGRRRPSLICAALHPGTVRSELSRPFTSKMSPDKLFTPEESCDHLSRVIARLKPADSGKFFAWDGQAIPY